MPAGLVVPTGAGLSVPAMMTGAIAAIAPLATAAIGSGWVWPRLGCLNERWCIKGARVVCCIATEFAATWYGITWDVGTALSCHYKFTTTSLLEALDAIITADIVHVITTTSTTLWDLIIGQIARVNQRIATSCSVHVFRALVTHFRIRLTLITNAQLPR